MGSPFIASTKDLMAMVLLYVTVILISLSGVSTSAVYRVGDSAGWTIIDHPDYKKWASTKRFHVGDTLIFSYHKQYHNLMKVSHHDYVHCNTNSAKAFYHSDSITLTKPGKFYFICSNDGHCLAGQKLHIKVHHSTSGHPSSLLATTPCPHSLGGKGEEEVSLLVSLSPIVMAPAILTASCLTIAAVLPLGTYFLV